MSSGRSIDYANRIFLSTNDILYANDSRPMFTIVADTVGRHDFLLTPCSQEMFRILYDHQGHHPDAFENLARELSRFGIENHRIGTTFNIFMNVHVGTDDAIDVDVPTVASWRSCGFPRRDGSCRRIDGLLGGEIQQAVPSSRSTLKFSTPSPDIS